MKLFRLITPTMIIVAAFFLFLTPKPAFAATACEADVDKNGKVEKADADLVLTLFGVSSTDPNFNPAYDLNKNGNIDLNDALIVSSLIGQPCATNLPASPPTSCSFSPTSILSPGSFFLTANGYTSGSYPVVMVDGFGGSVFNESIGNLTDPIQAFTIRSGISPGTYAIRITTAPGAFIQCAGGLNINPPPPGDPGGSTPGSLCPAYSTTGGFKISDFFQPAKHFCNFGILSSDILTILISAAGALSFVFIIVGGIKLVTSSGDPKAIASARGTLTYAIIGLVVTILAFIIVQVVQFFLKAKII